MRTTWTDTIQSEVTSLVTYPVAKDTGRWQAAKNLAPMPNVRGRSRCSDNRKISH